MMVVNYYTNKQEFLANCENKSRPELACEGKCILMKKLKAAEQKEEQEKKKQKAPDLQTFFHHAVFLPMS
jgi:hypothetical protein